MNYGMFGNQWIFYIYPAGETLRIQDHESISEYAHNYEPFKHGQTYLVDDGCNVYHRDDFEFEVFQIHDLS